MTIATCGHKVNEGITVAYKVTTRDNEPCTVCATMCAKCTLEYYRLGLIVNEDLVELIHIVSQPSLGFQKSDKG